MRSSRSNLIGLLAVASLAAAASGVGFPSTPAPQATPRRRERHDEGMARQKMLVEQRLTSEQQQWNAAVEAKRAAKKGKSK